MKKEKLPTIFVPHGGGPWNLMEDMIENDEGLKKLRDYLQKIGNEFKGKIKSILMISAHWEEKDVTIHFGKNPGMFYDYYGFPKYTYEVKYPAPGNPELALQVENLLNKNGFNTKRENKRGFDHGTFVPLMIAFPDANIPILQISLNKNLDPDFHYKLGQALKPLRDEGVLIMGNGMTFHNMQGFFNNKHIYREASEKFNNWLEKILKIENLEERKRKINEWNHNNFAKICHPREEHLIPLFVIAGAGEDSKVKLDFSEKMYEGLNISGFRFE